MRLGGGGGHVDTADKAVIGGGLLGRGEGCASGVIGDAHVSVVDAGRADTGAGALCRIGGGHIGGVVGGEEVVGDGRAGRSSQAERVRQCGYVVPQVVNVGIDVDGKQIECLGGDEVDFDPQDRPEQGVARGGREGVASVRERARYVGGEHLASIGAGGGVAADQVGAVLGLVIGARGLVEVKDSS